MIGIGNICVIFVELSIDIFTLSNLSSSKISRGISINSISLCKDIKCTVKDKLFSKSDQLYIPFFGFHFQPLRNNLSLCKISSLRVQNDCQFHSFFWQNRQFLNNSVSPESMRMYIWGVISPRKFITEIKGPEGCKKQSRKLINDSNNGITKFLLFESFFLIFLYYF